MSQENVEVVRRVYDRWGEGDFRASLEVLDPHVVLVWIRCSRPTSCPIPTRGRFTASKQSGGTHATFWSR
jgi:ketosteroid isomerase-like protein